jgi:hypothetical protein
MNSVGTDMFNGLTIRIVSMVLNHAMLTIADGNCNLYLAAKARAESTDTELVSG